jgi:hypothetical protein
VRFLTLSSPGSSVSQWVKILDLSIIVPWVLYAAVTIVIISFTEHQVHQQLMHRRSAIANLRKSFDRIFEAHAITHHKHYSAIFTDEPVAPGEDKEIRLNVHKAPIKTLPFTILIALVSWQWAVVFVGCVLLHHWIWNKIHLEMHKPEGRSFSHWPAYKFLARHHFLHHQYPSKNFNVVVPLADYVLGTNAHATGADMLEMEKLGLLTLKPEQAALLRKSVEEKKVLSGKR